MSDVLILQIIWEVPFEYHGAFKSRLLGTKKNWINNYYIPSGYNSFKMHYNKKNSITIKLGM